MLDLSVRHYLIKDLKRKRRVSFLNYSCRFWIIDFTLFCQFCRLHLRMSGALQGAQRNRDTDDNHNKSARRDVPGPGPCHSLSPATRSSDSGLAHQTPASLAPTSGTDGDSDSEPGPVTCEADARQHSDQWGRGITDSRQWSKDWSHLPGGALNAINE